MSDEPWCEYDKDHGGVCHYCSGEACAHVDCILSARDCEHDCEERHPA